MKNLIFVFTILCLLGSCKKDKKKATTSNNNASTKTETPDVKEEIEIDDSLVLSDEIADFLKNKMPGYDIVSKEKWLSAEELENMPKSIRPLYNDEIFIEGDFNGDGEEDFATFLMDKNGKIKIYAFHKTSSGYKKYELHKIGSGGFLGAGLEVEEPGFVYGGNKEVGLEYNGINFNVYDDAGTTFYYDAGRYRKVSTNNY